MEEEKSINEPIEGMNDIFGLKLRKLDFLFRKFTDIVNRFGYEQLETPLLEKASSFSEDIVGQSPWPEWDKRGCFYLEIRNFHSSFNEEPYTVDSLLIPEGTIPVTRWLGKYLDNQPTTSLPLKVFYKLPCFRNELINSLSETKRRQFNQFGLEILGSQKLTSDVEIIYLIKNMLTTIGIENSDIRIRISNVGIFNKLVTECNISHSDSIILKEAMDTIAECRAGKNPFRKKENIEKFSNTISKYSLTTNQNKMWDSILNHNEGIITKEIFSIFSEDYKEYLNELTLLCNELQNQGVNSTLDLCVVRSHEYYTGISFEVDVITESSKYIEIAGGGRYDKLVGNFVKDYKLDKIPSTGFAFGLERVLEMAEEMDMFKSNTTINSLISFESSNADSLLVLNHQSNAIDEYFKAIEFMSKNLNKRFDIYMGKDTEMENYMKERKIKEIIRLR